MMNIHADKIIANKFVGEFENNNNDGFNIGDIKWSSVDITHAGFLIANGASVRRDTYPDLYALYEAMDFPWGSVDEEHFNLPNLIGRFIEGSEIAGGYKEAGIPNIEGQFQPVGNSVGIILSQNDTTGAMYNLGQKNAVTSYINGTTAYGIGFDASKHNPIYGKSSTVQPNSILLTPYIKAFHGVSTNSADLEITKVANDLADKSNRDLSNLSEHGKKVFFPSDNFIILPNDTTRYIAPANGFFLVYASSLGNNSAYTIRCKQLQTHHNFKNYGTMIMNGIGDSSYLIVQKDSIISIEKDEVEILLICFIYADGNL